MVRCSECNRRNGVNNKFCVHCGTTLPTVDPNNQRKGILLPPQNVDTILLSREMNKRAYPVNYSSWMAVLLAVVVGLGGVYYWFFYCDIYQILAVDYQESELVNE